MDQLKETISRRFQRLCAGKDSLLLSSLYCIEHMARIFAHKDLRLCYYSISKRMKKKYLTGECYTLKEARLPLMDSQTDWVFWGAVFEDTFETYMEHDDCYDEAAMASYYDLLCEGTYGLQNEFVDVTVKAGDVVLDIGSWIGDFAAYASAKGAVTYAFEPSDATYGYLLKTAELNKNIYPVKKGLGNANTTVEFARGADDSLGDSVVLEQIPNSGRSRIDITTVDAFVHENGLTHVDFIKADIEGHERYMLEGAKETLKKFAPKLAICTYHLPDDPEVLEKLIEEANPTYRVVQKRKKLYASIRDTAKNFST
jgi:FkbM family methyltransferase